MKNNDFKENNFQISDPIESYFECISSCDIKMALAFQSVWKYLNIMKIDIISYFVD